MPAKTLFIVQQFERQGKKLVAGQAIEPCSADTAVLRAERDIVRDNEPAAALLGILDLHIHDLRHECVSRLFLRWADRCGKSRQCPGHRSRSSLQRYAHLRQTGDKVAGWKWLSVVAE